MRAHHSNTNTALSDIPAEKSTILPFTYGGIAGFLLGLLAGRATSSCPAGNDERALCKVHGFREESGNIAIAVQIPAFGVGNGIAVLLVADENVENILLSRSLPFDSAQNVVLNFNLNAPGAINAFVVLLKGRNIVCSQNVMVR